jgi:hypothetical protein
MRARAPGGSELRPGSDEQEQWRQRAAFSNAAQDIERGRNCAAMKAATPFGAMPANLSEIDDGGGVEC